MAPFRELRSRQSYYLEQVLDLPPLVSCAAFDTVVAGPLGGVTGVSPRLVATAAAAELFVDVHAPQAGPADPLAPYRTVNGTLRLGARRMAVEIELNPHSGHRTALGLRPLRWGWTAWPTASLMGAGEELLHTLAGALLGEVIALSA